MALVREDLVDTIISAMHERYYTPHGFGDNVIVAESIQGAGIL